LKREHESARLLFHSDALSQSIPLPERPCALPPHTAR
jgi:hypothetical protein